MIKRPLKKTKTIFLKNSAARLYNPRACHIFAAESPYSGPSPTENSR